MNRRSSLAPTSTGKLLFAHPSPPETKAIAFHPTEPILASSGKDGTIKQWDLNRFDCIATWKSPRPYENMNITGVTGLNAAQKQSLKQLGAVEHRSTR
jgi:WD40 repeat protein